jgi:putative hydrolase of the HAD superfamily
MRRFEGIDTWVFDLDNTIYDADAHVFVEMRALMRDFMVERFGLQPEEADKMRDRLWRKHGTTLRGLMDERGVDPHDFLRYTHAIDVSPVPHCAITQDALQRLPGRKFIFTNTTHSLADRVTRHLDIHQHFEGVFTIEDADFLPKPHAPTYDIFLKKYGINPKTACMFEDSEGNLAPAHALGMKTVWIGAPDATVPSYVQHRAETLAQWFSDVLDDKK